MTTKQPSVEVYLSLPTERYNVYLVNPSQGLAYLFVALEDRFGKKYTVRRHVIPVVRKYFAGATITPSVGVWQNEPPENSCVITLISVGMKWPEFIKKARRLRLDLEKRLKQLEILLHFLPPAGE